VLETHLKERARSLGFDLVGIAPATPADGFDRYLDWLDRGYAGDMDYLHRHKDARRHPSAILADVRSVVMVGLNYADCGMQNAECGMESTAGFNPQSEIRNPKSGKVARYADGVDYHTVLWQKLDSLLEWLQAEVPECHGRSVVDTAPLLERDFARRAGLGWIGKNTLLINKERGSYLYLGALLVDIELRPDPPHTGSHCGTCTACLDACPTAAFAGPGWLDARRCISYLTIELRDSIAEELRPGLGDWLFGCDVCQEVCPWNRHATGEVMSLDPIELLRLGEDEFRRRFRGTALWRARRRGLLRNAAIVLGNSGDESALPALRQALADPEPLVRQAAAWAIERISGARRLAGAES
jgi:epoxyqueuosine reductase